MDVLEPGLKAIFTEQYNEIPSNIPALYDVLTSETSYEKYSQLGGMANFAKFTGTVSYDTIYQQYDTKYVPDEYTGAIQVERKLWDDSDKRLSSLNLTVCENTVRASNTDEVTKWMIRQLAGKTMTEELN